MQRVVRAQKIYSPQSTGARVVLKLRTGNCGKVVPFSIGVQFSRDSIREFDDQIKIQEDRGL